MRRIGNRYTDQPRNHALFFNSTTPANPPSSRSHRKTEDTPPSKYLHTYIFFLRCDHGQCATTTLLVSRETGSHGFGGCGGRRGRGGGGDVEKAQRLFSYQRPVWGEIEINRFMGTHISRYVSNASFAAISSLRSFGGGTGPSSDGGSYSFDHGDLGTKPQQGCRQSHGPSPTHRTAPPPQTGGKGRGRDAPVTLAVLIVDTSEILFPRRPVNA